MLYLQFHMRFGKRECYCLQLHCSQPQDQRRQCKQHQCDQGQLLHLCSHMWSIVEGSRCGNATFACTPANIWVYDPATGTLPLSADPIANMAECCKPRTCNDTEPLIPDNRPCRCTGNGAFNEANGDHLASPTACCTVSALAAHSRH